MNAKDFVSLILEEDSEDSSGALFYFDGMMSPAMYVHAQGGEDIFVNIVDKIAEIHPNAVHKSVHRQDIDATIDNLMDQQNLVIVLYYGGELALYANDPFPAPKLNRDFVVALTKVFKVSMSASVAVFTSSNADPEIVTAREVFLGDAKDTETEPEVTVSDAIGAERTGDLATQPWDLRKMPTARSGAPHTTPETRKLFRGRFWGGREEPMTGDLERLWREDD